MKEKDLYVDFEPQQLVYYVEKEDQSYGPIISGSQLSANYLDDFWEKKKKLEISLRAQLANNEISTIYYYMILQEVGEKDLASRAGISIRKLQKFYDPQNFCNMKLKLLKVFADIFNVPLTRLMQNILIKEDDREQIGLEYGETKNEMYSLLKIRILQNG